MIDKWVVLNNPENITLLNQLYTNILQKKQINIELKSFPFRMTNVFHSLSITIAPIIKYSNIDTSSSNILFTTGELTLCPSIDDMVNSPKIMVNVSTKKVDNEIYNIKKYIFPNETVISNRNNDIIAMDEFTRKLKETNKDLYGNNYLEQRLLNTLDIMEDDDNIICIIWVNIIRFSNNQQYQQYFDSKTQLDILVTDYMRYKRHINRPNTDNYTQIINEFIRDNDNNELVNTNTLFAKLKGEKGMSLKQREEMDRKIRLLGIMENNQILNRGRVVPIIYVRLTKKI